MSRGLAAVGELIEKGFSNLHVEESLVRNFAVSLLAHQTGLDELSDDTAKRTAVGSLCVEACEKIRAPVAGVI